MAPEEVYMSRRREALDLARALALSTQEALAVAELPPHTLSSKTTTQDSREMELKAVIDPRLVISSREGPSGSDSGPSVINSFTPQLAIRPSSILGSSSTSFPTPAQQSRSSPILPIPSSRLATHDKNRSSGSSSHRALFSPTQTSKDRPGSGPTPQNGTPPREMPGRNKNNRRIVLSSSPPEVGHAGKHPSSDQEEQEEIEERPKATTSSRLAPRPWPMSPPPIRQSSPDPLAANLSGVVSPTTVLIEESIMVIDPPRARGEASVPVESQTSMAESASTRRSHRVVENEAKKEREKEERRARRKAEKEAKAKKEAERQKREGDKERGKQALRSPMRKSMRLEVEVSLDDRRRSTRTAPESIIVLDHIPTRPTRDAISAPHRPLATPKVIDSPQASRSSKWARAETEEEVKEQARSPQVLPVESVTNDEDFEPAESIAEIAPPTKPVNKKTKKESKAAKKGNRKLREKVAASLQEDSVVEGVTKQAAKSVIALAVDDSHKRAEESKSMTQDAERPANVEPKDGMEQARTEEEEEDMEAEKAEDAAAIPPIVPPDRSPLRTHASNMRPMPVTAFARDSPGPSSSGIKWKTSRNDLNSVLSKFPGARQTGMSRKLKIAPLHMKIGPPVKALPPPPPKPSRKKKEESDDDDDDEEAEMESDGEGGMRKKRKVKGIEWYMEED